MGQPHTVTPAATSTPAVTVVVPVRDGAAHLPACLASLARAAQDPVAAEVIVVDNGSTDGSGEIARAHGARVIPAPGLRVGAVRNAGAREARGRIVAFVDADNEVAGSWLAGCAEALADPSVGAAGLPYQAPPDATWVQRVYDQLRWRPASRADTEWLSAGNIALRREVFDQLGGFDETLEACEDVDLCARVRRAGLRTVAEPAMASIHHGDPRTLGALFLGELWRGRDNLRVSLRGPLTLRAVPGVVLPLLTLTLLAALPLAAVTALVASPLPLAVAAAALAAIALVRTTVIVRRGRLYQPLAWARSLAVAATFELGRALALLGRATHRTRTRPQAV